MRGFALTPEEAATEPMDGAQARGSWRQADVKRAIKAAKQAGLSSYRVEIGPDGTISIVVGAPPEAPEG